MEMNLKIAGSTLSLLACSTAVVPSSVEALRAGVTSFRSLWVVMFAALPCFVEQFVSQAKEDD